MGIHKIFVNPNHPNLVFPVAAILDKIGDGVSVVVPAAVSHLANEEQIRGLIFTLPVTGILDEIGESDRIYLVGIGPDNQKDEIILNDFIDRHQEEIILWIDNHNWSQEAWEIAKQKCFIKKYGQTSLGTLLSLDYRHYVTMDWQIAEKALSSTDENIIFGNPLARRYFLALEVSRVIAKNIGNDYYNQTFWNIVKEICYKKKNSEISCLQDLALLMRRETRRAISQIDDDCPHFSECKSMGRPVGYLKLDKAEEYTDIDKILTEGLKKFPWLVVIECTLNGKQIFSANSKEIDIKEILDYYFGLDIEAETVLRFLNAEIIRRINV